MDMFNCEQYSLVVLIKGLEGIYYKLDSFISKDDTCRQIIHYENITKFFEEYYTNKTLDKTELN